MSKSKQEPETASEPNDLSARESGPGAQRVETPLGAGLGARLTRRRERDPRGQFFAELHLKLLEAYGPPSVVINQVCDIVHLSEHAGRYLRFGGGEPSANLLKLVHPALRIELRGAILRARREKTNVEVKNVTVEIDGTKESFDVEVRPLRTNNETPQKEEGEQDCTLVLFEKKTGRAPNEQSTSGPGAEPHAQHLEAELQHIKEQLNTTVEQYEASNGELKASNKKLQALNEEIRSAAEELETSTKEFQSANDELTTVNQELKSNIEELRRANSDLQNLMAATDIGTIFLDRQLRIKLFTRRVQRIFNVIPADIGRPLSDITHKMEYKQLAQDAETVLHDLRPIERDVRDGGGTWFLARLVPSRTSENKVDGVVLTFVEITQRKRAENELRELSERMQAQLEKFNAVMTAVPDFIYYFNLEGRFTYANQALLDLWRKSYEEVDGKNFHELDYPPELATRLQRQIQEVIETRRQLKDETPYTSALGARQYEYIFFPLLADDGSVAAVGGTTRDITDRKEAEQASRESEERFRQFAENSADVFWIVDARAQRLEYINPVYEEMWGESRENIMQDIDHWSTLVHPDDREKARSAMPKVLAGETVVIEYRIVRPSDGATRWIRDTGFPIRDEKGEVYRVAGVAQDVTEDKNRTEELAESDERFRLLIDGTPDYAMFLLDPGNQIIYWSAGAERVFGWSSDEALGKSGELIFTPEDRANGREEKEMAIARRDGVAPDRRWHLRKDGTRIWVDGIMRRLDDEHGEPRGYAKIGRDATDQRLAEEALQKSHGDLELRVQERTADLTASNQRLQAEIAQRTQLEQEILLVSEREKRRIGQDLHDSLCQELAAAAFFLQSSAHQIEEKNPEGAKALTAAAKIVNTNVGLARDLARGLYPVELSTSGLTNALRELAFRTSHDPVQCVFECPKAVRVRDDAVALNLYRIAQEAVTNALKNGNAKKIVIRLVRRREKLLLTVEDEGGGFSTKAPSKGMGIHIMKYRANVIGGTLAVESKEGRGTVVTCALPIAGGGRISR